MDLIRYLNTVSNNEGMSNYTIIEILKKFCAEIDQNMISSIHVNNVTPSTAKFQIVLKNGTIYQSEAISLPQGEKGDKGDKGDTGVTPNLTILVTGLPAGSDPTVTKSGTVDNPIYTLGIPEGEKGDTGNGIESIIKTDTSGLVDTYTITFTNGTTSTFTVTNGEDGTDGQDGNGIVSISKTGTSGLIDTYTITFTNGTTSTFTVTNGANGTNGQDGNGIVSISKTGTSGLIDTYTIAFTNGTSSTFNVTNGATGATGATGNGISAVTKTGSSGRVSTYTIYFTNGTSTTFNVTDGADGANGADGVGISSIAKTGTAGLVDTYTIYYTNNTTSTFTVTNGDDGFSKLTADTNLWTLNGGIYKNYSSSNIKIYATSQYFITMYPQDVLIVSRDSALSVSAICFNASTSELYWLRSLNNGANGSIDTFAKSTAIPTKTSQLTNDSGFITSAEQVDTSSFEDYVGWIRYKSGLQICWGWNNLSGSNGNSDQSNNRIIFPKAFSQRPGVAATTGGTNLGSGYNNSIMLQSPETTQVYVRKNFGENRYIYWIAIGKWN